MKILFVSNGFPPHRWAGTETYSAAMANELSRQNHTVHILCVGRWNEGQEYWQGFEDSISDGVQVRRIHLNWMKAPSPFRYLYDNHVVGNHVAVLLEQLQPDVVHVTSCETVSASVLYEVRKAGIPSVISLTDFWFLCPRITLLHSDGSNCSGRTTGWECLRCQLFNAKAYRWPRRVLPERLVSVALLMVSRFPPVNRQRGLRGMAGNMEHRKAFLQQALSWPDIRVTASSFVREVYVQNGVTAPIKVQAYGHDLSWLRNYAGKTYSPGTRIGFIGQITPSKGVHLLLQACAALPNDLKGKFCLSIYGNMRDNDQYCSRLRALAGSMDNVHFCGTYSHEDSYEVFANLDVLVVPSLWYDFPLIIHEAFATKTPVIATNLGGMAENVANEVSGLLFERGDVAALSSQLRRIITEPELLQRLQAGIQPVKTIEEEINEMEAIYNLISRKRPSTGPLRSQVMVPIPNSVIDRPLSKESK